jgi:hypothetical protein
MKHTPAILLLTLVAASASAAVGAGNDLNYDRLGVGYESNDLLKSFVVSGEAKLGEYVLVGGSYSDVSGKGDNDGYDGNIVRFGLGAVFTAGPGDLIFRASYGQGNIATDDFDSAGVADESSFGLSYRAALGAGFEGELGYARVRTRMAGYNNVDIAAGIINDNVFRVTLRHNFTSNFDVRVTYLFQDDFIGGDTFGISAGYSF